MAKHFVAAHEQVGDFRVVNVNGKINKNGGNVASHFLTPDGHVIHSVTGPVSATALLDEAEFAVNLYQEVKDKPRLRRWRGVSEAHQLAAMSPRNGQDAKIHRLLMNRPLPDLADVYEQIFENVLGEKVSNVGPMLADVAKQIERAQKAKRPILFVLDDKDYGEVPRLPFQTKQLINEFTIIQMPLRAAPALSQLTGQPPFEVNGKARPMIVATNSECKQLASVAGWSNISGLNAVLSTGWIDAMEKHPPDVRRLSRAERLLRRVSPEGVDWGSDLIQRLRKKDARPDDESEQRDYKSEGYQLASR